MLSEREYVIESLELHLFFSRIMKEHSIFLEAGFTPRDKDFAQTADHYKVHFEAILYQAVTLSQGIISEPVLKSGEIVTDFTYNAEEKTQNLTGIAINQNITALELNLVHMDHFHVTSRMVTEVKQINENVLICLDGLIAFKTQVLNSMLSCHMFTTNYPLLVKHILREAELYKKYVLALESGKSLKTLDIREQEIFWDQIMMEHVLFIRGLLDPTENKLVETSNNFAKIYNDLLEQATAATDATIFAVTNKTLEETMKLKDFKTAGVKGISECKIQSIIVPLLADHVLREANHFIRILKT